MVQKQIVREIVQAHQKNVMEMGEFFISWNAVPTLAYRAFNPILLKIKREIETKVPCLQPENPGSLWPKTTLGSLRDDKALSWDDTVELRQICDKFNPKLNGLTLEIDELSIVLFHCRSLERRLSTENIPLSDPRCSQVSSPNHNDEVVRKHVRDVVKTMDQFSASKLVEYWPNIQKPGNRESHYRAPFIQATLVFDLKAVPDAIRHFRKTVDQKLNGLYCWFEDKSLHMTVRALA